ncbi:hypothetical protein PIIN_10448 [Serendipita indica DSM 11827]|uniref:Uncharacterized protein n=1 Tax=Serendipita indica (strain DSM 11827) TaxID=1109443 RepID=G4TYR2_SERID|nr:hypothetical protein PIIN_10448 [Serendipita indica DSM 11827]
MNTLEAGTLKWTDDCVLFGNVNTRSSATAMFAIHTPLQTPASDNPQGSVLRGRMPAQKDSWPAPECA